MYQSILPKVLDKYGIMYRKIFDMQKGYRNEIWPVLTDNDQMINVTFYKKELGIVDTVNRANVVSEFLVSAGMPARKRFDKRILLLKNDSNEINVGIYEYLPGETIPWEAYTMERIKNLGGVMGEMHRHLSKMHTAAFPSVYEEYLTIVDRMKIYFARNEVDNAVQSKLGLKINYDKFEQYQKLLEQYSTLSGQQILHMDFVRGNVLFIGNEISGILDFEKTAVGHTVVDIARTLAFLLVDCKYKTSEKVIKYFLYSGYQKRGDNIDIGDNQTRLKLIEMFLLYDFYKFLRHNPYESLHLNEHYMRTKDILVKLGVIYLK